MKILDVIAPINDGKHKREVGRYWASDINSIIGGYLKPEDFFKEKEFNGEGSTNIFFGVALENELTKRFTEKKVKVIGQTKYEMKIDDEITLVVKPDFETSTTTIECKCPKLSIAEIPPRYKYQLEAEHRATGKPTWLLSFQKPELVMFPYEPNEETWLKVVKTLKLFHKKLKIYNTNVQKL